MQVGVAHGVYVLVDVYSYSVYDERDDWGNWRQQSRYMRAKFTQQQIDSKLRQIQAEIPREYLQFDEVPVTPVMKELADEIIATRGSDDELRIKLEVLRRAGTFTHTSTTIRPECADKVNEWLTARLRNAIARGELPPASSAPFVRKLRALKRGAGKK